MDPSVAKLGLTRTRITKLLDLTLLAPDLQFQVLELERVDSVEPLAERQLRGMAAAGTWPQQRAAWAAILAKEPRGRVPAGSPPSPPDQILHGPNPTKSG